MKKKIEKKNRLVQTAQTQINQFKKSRTDKNTARMLRSFENLLKFIETFDLSYAEKMEETEFALDELKRFHNYLPVMLGYWDRELKNVYSNKAYADYFGKSPEHIKGGHFKDLLGTDIYKKNLPYARAALKGKAQTFERLIPTPSGKIRHTLAHYVPDELDGVIRGFFVIVSDITSVKDLENQNRNMEAKLVSNSKMSALGEMAGAIAHEVNNPLSIIYGRACQLESLLKKPDVNAQILLDRVREIQETSRRIEKIIDGLRAISRQTGTEPLRKHSIQDVIDQTLILCVGRMRALKIKFKAVKVSSDVLVRCRPIQISQIILNLLNNAIDAVSSETNPWIRLDLRISENQVVLGLSNSGPRIQKDVVEKIFQPFFTTKAEDRGTGLGLSIARSLAEANSGRLEYIEKSKNPRFELTLKR